MALGYLAETKQERKAKGAHDPTRPGNMELRSPDRARERDRQPERETPGNFQPCATLFFPFLRFAPALHSPLQRDGLKGAADDSLVQNTPLHCGRKVDNRRVSSLPL
ncbi:hypothetical protein AOLI_G00256150 [Acnodon oligacanthus]